MAVMCYRATAISATGASPAQLMTERQIWTTVPLLDGKLQPKRFSHNTVKQKDQKAKQAYQFFYNRRHTVHPYWNYTLDRVSESIWTERKDGKYQQLSSANLQSRDPTLWKLNTAPSLRETCNTFRLFQSHLLQRDSSRTTKESPSLQVRASQLPHSVHHLSQPHHNWRE